MLKCFDCKKETNNFRCDECLKENKEYILNLSTKIEPVEHRRWTRATNLDREHFAKDILQPSNPAFEKIYGKKK